MAELGWESRWGTVLCLVCFRRTHPEHVVLRCPQDHPSSTISAQLVRQHQPVFISPHEAFDQGADLWRRYYCPEGIPHSYEPACPHCDASLRLSLDARGRRLVFFVGPPQSGKTMLFYAIKRTLESGPTAARIIPAQAASDFEELVENPLNRNELPAGTLDALLQDGRTGPSDDMRRSVRTLGLDIRAWQVLLPVIDPQGEDFRSTTDFGVSVEARLRHASGLFLIVDPTKVPELRPYTCQAATAAPGAADLYNYQTLVQSLHESMGMQYGSRARLSVCVLVTKADSLKECGQYGGIAEAMSRGDKIPMPTDPADQPRWQTAAARTQEISEAFVHTLMELNFGNLVRAVEHSFDRTAFFPVSCVDEENIDREAFRLNGAPTPHGVAAPLLWMASEVRG